MGNLTIRNIKLYFKDRSTFMTSMITPIILLVLFMTFLGNVYSSSFESAIPEGFELSADIVDAFTVGWLFSSLIGVSCVTVAFCSNIIMAQDKISGARADILASPVKKSTLAISYFAANYISTAIICLVVTFIGFAVMGNYGGEFEGAQIAKTVGDVLLCVLFGTSFAAFVENFISTQGGIGAVSTLISALYGFICGAYMPISEFGEGVGNAISYLPGTYTMGLLRNDFLNGVLSDVSAVMPSEFVDSVKDAFDVNMYFDGSAVEQSSMYVIVIIAAAVFLGAYIMVNKFRENAK